MARMDILGVPRREDQDQSNLRIERPVSFVLNPFQNEFSYMSVPESDGTTILAMEYDGGVLISSDSMVSQGGLISSRFRKKVRLISDTVACASTGATAHSSAVIDIIKHHVAFHEVETGEKADVSVVASMFRNVIFRNREKLSTSIIIAGWDKRKGGQIMYAPNDGLMVRRSLVYAGSGSLFVSGFLEANYRPGLSKDEARKLTQEAISYATRSDRKSGGTCTVAFIDQNGIDHEFVRASELPGFYDE